MAENSPTIREDVLGAFAMEFESGTGVLERYLSQYPEYSLQLVDLSRELSREIDEDRPLSADELATVNTRMRRLQKRVATLQSLLTAPAKIFTDAVKASALPIQAGLALRERRVEVSTIPVRILETLAEELQASVAVLSSYLALPPHVSQLRANKSSIKPTAAEKVSFERILREAGLDEATLSKQLNND
ncbi:hypothetical protein [Nevskia ramosa]|uniref:hypothetical protein n=1 Tax=Nevskia ramosa TaxID=64002 RepID=UPI002354F2E1|nr:hypothetical protein [Nevskia ramosa]